MSKTFQNSTKVTMEITGKKNYNKYSSFFDKTFPQGTPLFGKFFTNSDTLINKEDNKLFIGILAGKTNN